MPTNILDATEQFMRAAGQGMGNGFTDPATRELRLKLLTEENREYVTAERANDSVEVGDGLADQIVVAWGTLLSYHGPEVAKRGANLDPIVEVAGTHHFPFPWDLSDVHRNESLTNITRIFDKYAAAEASNDLDKITDNLVALIRECVVTMWIYYGPGPTNLIFNEVSRSNLDKILPDGTCLKNEFGKVIKPEGWVGPRIREILTARDQVVPVG